MADAQGMQRTKQGQQGCGNFGGRLGIGAQDFKQIAPWTKRVNQKSTATQRTEAFFDKRQWFRRGDAIETETMPLSPRMPSTRRPPTAPERMPDIFQVVTLDDQNTGLRIVDARHGTRTTVLESPPGLDCGIKSGLHTVQRTSVLARHDGEAAPTALHGEQSTVAANLAEKIVPTPFSAAFNPSRQSLGLRSASRCALVSRQKRRPMGIPGRRQLRQHERQITLPASGIARCQNTHGVTVDHIKRPVLAQKVAQVGIVVHQASGMQAPQCRTAFGQHGMGRSVLGRRSTAGLPGLGQGRGAVEPGRQQQMSPVRQSRSQKHLRCRHAGSSQRRKSVALALPMPGTALGNEQFGEHAPPPPYPTADHALSGQDAQQRLEAQYLAIAKRQGKRQRRRSAGHSQRHHRKHRSRERIVHADAPGAYLRR